MPEAPCEPAPRPRQKAKVESACTTMDPLMAAFLVSITLNIALTGWILSRG